MALDQLVQTGVGSADWAGRYAPAGGTHTGTATVVTYDGARFSVAHSRAEALQKLSSAAPVPTGRTRWVAFDVPASSTPVVLDADQVEKVTASS